MKIGDEVYVHGYIDEIRQDTVIIRNNGGYFGTVPSEVVEQEPSCRNTRQVDLISRQAAIDVVNRAVTKEVARWSIQELPSADRPTGHWIDTQVDSAGLAHRRICSICEEEPAAWSSVNKFDFCPNCGADMRGGEEE